MLDFRVLGLNCGTSVDGIDCALCHFRQDDPSSPLRLELERYDEIPMDPIARQKILDVIRNNNTSLEAVCQLGFIIGQVFADAAEAFGRRYDIAWADVDLVASHGQTCWHIPLPEPDQVRSTQQIMESTVLSQRLEVTVVSDFRTGEVAAGRHGAPLVGFIDALLASDTNKSRAIQNIGGIANYSYLPRGDPQGVFEFDTGPGNVWIDYAMRHFTDGKMQYDKDGEWAKRGTVDGPVVERILRMEYFGRPLPKTTGRELFGDEMAAEIINDMLRAGRSKEDCVATLTRVTAESIVQAYRNHIPPNESGEPDLDEVYMCGGGGFNDAIMDHLRSCLPNTVFHQLDSLGIKAQAKEAVSFAILGLECILGRSIIIPQHVDTRDEVILGKITPHQRNWLKVLHKIAAYRPETSSSAPITQMLLEHA